MTSKQHECGVCGKRFKWNSNLMQHLAIHSNEAMMNHYVQRCRAIIEMKWSSDMLRRVSRVPRRGPRSTCASQSPTHSRTAAKSETSNEVSDIRGDALQALARLQAFA